MGQGNGGRAGRGVVPRGRRGGREKDGERELGAGQGQGQGPSEGPGQGKGQGAKGAPGEWMKTAALYLHSQLPTQMLIAVKQRAS